MMITRYIIIGTSASGLGAAIKLRDLDPNGSILCISAESEMPYNRCLLADYLAGSKSMSAVLTKSQDFFDQKNITLMLDSCVVKIDAENKYIILQTGQTLLYDKIFIGTGRSGWIPNLPGSDFYGVFPFYSLRDTTLINDFIVSNNPSNAVVVGGGLSGLECADALAAKNMSVRLIERQAHILPQQLDFGGALFLTTLMKKYQVIVESKDTVVEILKKNEKVCGVLLASGKIIDTQMVIFALGGSINNDLACQANLTMYEKSIVVDDQMRTSNQSIFAGGDVCVVKNLLTKQLTQSVLWTDAVIQGMVGAYSMVGDQQRRYPGTLIVTSSNIYNTTFVSCGPVADSNDYEAIILQGEDYYHLNLVDNQKRLKGFALVGKIDNVGELRKRMLAGIDKN